MPSALGIGEDGHAAAGAPAAERLSALQFFRRYPVFFLAFGPPIFRSIAGIDATKGQVDIWAVLQVIWLGAISARAILRLAAAEWILIPRQVWFVLKLAFFLGLLFLASALYSSSRLVSAAYAILYLLTIVCIIEFLADAYRNPPNWLQCIFALRLVALTLLAVVILTALVDPVLVLSIVPGAGVRFTGGAVAPLPVICPMIAIISAYSFLHGLESKVRSVCFFGVGLIGTLGTQTRGSELALLLALVLLGLGWARRSRRSAYLFVFGCVASILLFGIALGAFGGEHIWEVFNRNESAQGIESASGRTDIWKFVIQYCLSHPQGMGYVAGFRTIFRQYFTLGLQVEVSHIGNSHNAFLDVLGDAGWLALGMYLLMLARIVAIGRRVASPGGPGNPSSRAAIRCAFAMLVFCLGYGMAASDFVVPLRADFYWQNIIVAILLGISQEAILASRAHPDPGSNSNRSRQESRLLTDST
ncbi:MAG: O-antigen ligase family protein [Terracidiphilus sp.]